MDPAVVQAMAKWPSVPNVFGWLSLDRRGNWLIKGDRIANPGIIAFIGRNYAQDELGRFFFQNGPQRVFVTLAYTPYVALLESGAPDRLHNQTGQVLTRVSGVWIDEGGSMLLRWEAGVGVVNDRDLEAVLRMLTDVRGSPIADAFLARALDADSHRRATGLYFDYAGVKVPVGRIRSEEVALKFGFDPSPRQKEGEPEC
jgi:Protein of unknown function (DUF2946)